MGCQLAPRTMICSRSGATQVTSSVSAWGRAFMSAVKPAGCRNLRRAASGISARHDGQFEGATELQSEAPQAGQVQKSRSACASCASAWSAGRFQLSVTPADR